MEKLYEKKNFGVPVIILSSIAYLIGYVMTFNLNDSLLVAILFAAVVFGFQFEDRVKSAVKQSFMIAILVRALAFCFTLLEKLIELVTPQEFNASLIYSSNLEDLSDMYDLNAFQNALQYILKYGRDIVDVAVVVVFLLFIIQTIRNKELTFGFVQKILGDRIPQGTYQQYYQQPAAPTPQNSPSITCPNCGKVHPSGAAFCGGCGTKLQK